MRVDDGLYDDPRGKEKGGSGAINPGYVDQKNIALDIAVIERELRAGRPVILYGSSPEPPYDHYVLAVGIEQRADGVVLIANDRFPPGDDDEAPARAIEIRLGGSELMHPNFTGLRFEHMRLVHD